MPQETDPKDKNSSVIANRLKHISFLLIISLLCAALTGMYVSGSDIMTVRSCIYGSAFVLSFGFLLIYYIDVNKENILSVPSSRLIMALIPSVCLFILHCGNAEVASCAIVVLLAFLSGCFNFTLSSLVIFMLYVYSVLFSGFTVVPSVGTMLFIFAVCLFSRSVFTLKNSLYSALIVMVFYAIVICVESDFVTSEMFSTFHIVLAGSGVLSLIAVRFLVMILSKGLSGSSALRFTIPPDAVSTTDVEASHSFVFGEKSASEVYSEAIPEDIVSKEDYEKLEERLSRVYKEKDELQEKLTELSNKKSILSIADVCSEDFLYLVRLKLDNPGVYEHSLALAEISSGAAKAILCDDEFTYALGIIHDAGKILGNDYIEILSSKYCVPDYLIKSLVHTSNKTIDFPIMRETGIVILVNDMINAYEYVTRNVAKQKNEGEEVVITWSEVVRKTIKHRNSHNFLRYCGYSSDEVNTIIDFLTSVGGDSYQINN